jgi:hypothetical protein
MNKQRSTALKREFHIFADWRATRRADVPLRSRAAQLQRKGSDKRCDAAQLWMPPNEVLIDRESGKSRFRQKLDS